MVRAGFPRSKIYEGFRRKRPTGADIGISRGCKAARAEGQGFASEKADIGATHVQSGTDLVGADWERRLATGSPNY